MVHMSRNMPGLMFAARCASLREWVSFVGGELDSVYKVQYCSIISRSARKYIVSVCPLGGGIDLRVDRLSRFHFLRYQLPSFSINRHFNRGDMLLSSSALSVVLSNQWLRTTHTIHHCQSPIRHLLPTCYHRPAGKRECECHLSTRWWAL